MYHKKIVSLLKKHQGEQETSESYVLSGHFYYGVSVPTRRKICKEILKDDISYPEFIKLLDQLYKGKSHEEKTLASYLLGYFPEYRYKISLSKLDKWLNELQGWAEVDALCQNIFTHEELLGNWDAWEKFLIKLSKSQNINKRRASLVFLVPCVNKSNDKRLHSLAFRLINDLKHEKEILITKSISWLLRYMVEINKGEVEKYLNSNSDSLPKIAIRETQKKIRTGKKN